MSNSVPQEHVVEQAVGRMVEWVAFVAGFHGERRDHPLGERPKALLAVPLFATGHGGLQALSGELLRNYIESLQRACEDYNVDMLLCVRGSNYVVAQSIRKALVDEDESKLFPYNFDRNEAYRLAELAKNGKLSLFFGAGVSVPAGLPTWGGLLKSLYAEIYPAAADIDEAMNTDLSKYASSLPTSDESWSDRRVEELTKLRNQAQVAWWDHMLEVAEMILQKIENQRASSSLQRSVSTLRQEGKHQMGRGVKELLGSPKHTLGHALLASLPVTSFMTSNFDQLFEQACQVDSSTKLSTIVYSPDPAAKRWLLKMHGCLSTPEKIVLTASDYDEYERGAHAALKSVVQAELMTSHVLFVGFGFADPNMELCLDQVCNAWGIVDDRPQRTVTGSRLEDPSEYAGTVLFLGGDE